MLQLVGVINPEEDANIHGERIFKRRKKGTEGEVEQKRGVDKREVIPKQR